MNRRDLRTKYSSYMEDYIEDYGHHFNKSLFDFATSMMKDKDGNALKVWDKTKTDEVLTSHGIKIKNNLGHDAAYVMNMARADYYGGSLKDENQLVLYVKEYLDDIDGAESRAFDEFYIKTVALGIPIFWDEML